MDTHHITPLLIIVPNSLDQRNAYHKSANNTKNCILHLAVYFHCLCVITITVHYASFFFFFFLSP